MEERRSIAEQCYNCIVSQYLEYAENMSKSKGRGLNMFYITSLDKNDYTNCRYCFFPYDTPQYTDLQQKIECLRKYDENYDDSLSFMIGVIVDVENDESDSKWVDGKIGLFEFETRNEIKM